MAFLAAVDALESANIPLTSNIRVVIEGDEEAGSPSLESMMRDHGDKIRGDALIMVDGPRHASGRPTMFFGTRGMLGATVTVYGRRAICTAATTGTGRQIRRSPLPGC
jgi:acetylornithine deacetylase/succinyl-diaminopimelate desuccinylase-like protein